MKLTKKEKTIKYLCYCLLIGVGALLQNVGGLWLEIGGARCFWLIPLAIVLGIDEDERIASMFGLFAGLLWDCVSAQHMGFNAVFLMIVCYLLSTLVTYLLVSTYWVKVVSCIVAEFLYVLLHWLMFVVTKGGDGSVISFAIFYFPSFVYTGVVTLAIVELLDPVVRKLNKEPKLD